MDIGTNGEMVIEQGRSEQRVGDDEGTGLLGQVV